MKATSASKATVFHPLALQRSTFSAVFSSMVPMRLPKGFTIHAVRLPSTYSCSIENASPIMLSAPKMPQHLLCFRFQNGRTWKNSQYLTCFLLEVIQALEIKNSINDSLTSMGRQRRKLHQGLTLTFSKYSTYCDRYHSLSSYAKEHCLVNWMKTLLLSIPKRRVSPSTTMS